MTRLTAQDLTNSISEANLPDKPSTPNVKRNTVLGGILGVMISTFILLLRYITVKQTTADRKDEIQVEIEVTFQDADKVPDKEDES
jgi:capsular polysaccharide biosynthesis protein